MQDDIDFGHFHHNYDEPSVSGSSMNGYIRWFRTSDLIVNSPQGFLNLSDQRHFIVLEIPPSFIRVGHQIIVTFKWELVGDLDESVG